MKKVIIIMKIIVQPISQLFFCIRSIAAIIICAALLLFTFSFTVQKELADDFLKQLGISKTDADFKISTGVLYGSLDATGLKNIKNITLGNRKEITNDLLVYTKKYVNSAAFIKEYNEMREKKKPVKQHIQSPEEMHKGIISESKKNIADLEAKKKKDPANKAMFEKLLETLRKQLQQVEDPNYKMIANYRNGYPKMLTDQENLHQRHLIEWETKYPVNHLLFIKPRLQQFMEETKDIDFDAELYVKNNIKYFANPVYERKGSRWKMAFRAGKQVVDPARVFVQDWIRSLP